MAAWFGTLRSMAPRTVLALKRVAPKLACIGGAAALAAVCTESSCASTSATLDIPRTKEALFYTTLLRKRVIFLNGTINEESARVLVAQLMYLELEAPGEPITMYITSGGGLVYAGLAIYDTMQHISSPVHTVCVGHAESMAAILLSAGEPGQRRAMPHSRVMVHQPSLGVNRATAADVMIQAKEGEVTKQRLVTILSRHTGLSEPAVGLAIDRNAYYSAQEAHSFGLIDGILTKPAVPLPPKKSVNETAATRATAEKPVTTRPGPVETVWNGVQVYKRPVPAEAICVSTVDAESAKK